MKSYLTLTTLASLMAIATTSQALENCPEVSEIEQIAPGIYRANGEHGEWSGVLQGVAAKTAPVQYFEMALAIQEQQPAPNTFSTAPTALAIRTCSTCDFWQKMKVTST